MSGDIFFEDQLQRTISVDIRYTLFIIDKYAGASTSLTRWIVKGKKKRKEASHLSLWDSVMETAARIASGVLFRV